MPALQSFTIGGVTATVIYKDVNGNYYSWGSFPWDATHNAWIMAGNEWEIEPDPNGTGQFRLNHDHTSHSDSSTGTYATPDSTTGIVTLTNSALSGHTVSEVYCKPPSGNPVTPMSTNPKIDNIVITKTSDQSISISFDWENLDSFTLTNSRGGVPQTGTGTLSGNSGTVSTTFLPSISCQEGDLCWVHGNYSNSSLEHHPTEYGSQSNPYIFKVVNFSRTGTALTVSTFLAGATSLNNDADLRVWDFSDDTWSRYGYINYDGTLQTTTIDPFERGKAYYVVDRSTGNDYGTRYIAPGGRKTRGRTFW